MKWFTFILCSFILFSTFTTSFGWGSKSDRVRLEDVKVLTLHHGQMTNARRSAPVPQLKCVGGTAGCSAFVPQVVQCYNMGSDGFDVQWECKTDMDNEYRFGRVEVVCEGYDYPNDPYILAGSCGLEYTLDLTKEGHQKKGQNTHHNYHGSQSNYYYDTGYNDVKGSSKMGSIIVLVVIAVVIYALFKTCLQSNYDQRQSFSTTDDDQRPYGSGGGYGSFGPSAPPPPGFRPEYGGTDNASCGGRSTSSSGSTGGGGFWTGAATGGLLGYMFGSQGRNNYGNYHHAPRYGWGGGSSWFRPTGYSSPHTYSNTTRSSPPSSSGTRTASGFGGTRRR